MFINLTNHPSSGWSEEQLKAAQQYGEVVDIPFPHIEPYFSTEEVKKMTKQTVDEIQYMDTNPVVHVMGEMTFTYQVVTSLKSLGINCVASTTERIVKEEEGKIISQFKFVQFREY